jgi:hypothetical protein
LRRLAVALGAGVLVAGGTLAFSVAERPTAANAGTTGVSPVIYTTLGPGGYDTINLNTVGAGPTSTNPLPQGASGDGPVAINVNATDALIGVDPAPGATARSPALLIVPVTGGSPQVATLPGFRLVVGIAADPVAPGVAFAVGNQGAVDEVNFSSFPAVVTPIVGPNPNLGGVTPAATAIAITPNGQRLIVGFGPGPNSAVRAWGVYQVDLSTSPPALSYWLAPTGAAMTFSGLDLAISPGGGAVYATAYVPSDSSLPPNPIVKLPIPFFDRTAPVWSTTTGGVSEPASLTVSPDGQTVDVAGAGYTPAGSLEGEVQALSAGNGSPGAAAAVPGLTGASGIAGSPDGSTLLVAGSNGSASFVYPVSVSSFSVGTPASLGANGTGVAPQDITVTPDQAPTANLAAAAGTAGVSLTLDASASNVRYGSIVQYQWLFGDGGSATTSGPTVSHTYSAAGTYTATVTVTDSAGTSIPPAPYVSGNVNGPGKTAYINAGYQARASALVAIGQPGKPPPTIPSVTTTTVKPSGTPVITVTPQVGRPGEVIWIAGHGFLPNHPVTVKWSITSGSFTENADAHGNLPSHSLVLLVPTILGPRMAVATSPGSPTVQQKLLVVPSTAEPGSGSGSDTFMFRSEGP